jgi:acyl-homoserine-lactone acylase
VIKGSALTPKGYWINNGTSYLMTVEFTPSGPMAYTILTYGETGDRSSELFTSQTEMFSVKDWKRVPLTADEIDKDAIRDPVTVSG